MIAFTYIFCITSITALHQPDDFPNPEDMRNERVVTDSIVAAVEATSQYIKDAGLDPYYIERQHFGYTLPVPVIFSTATLFEEIMSTGLSNIKVHRMNYAMVTSRLSFEIEMPNFNISIGAASTKTTLFGSKLEVKVNGKVEIRNIRLVGQVRINVGIISGISIRSISITFIMGGIESNLHLRIQGVNFSTKLKKFINIAIPNALYKYNADVNELLEIFLLDFLNANLHNTQS